MADTTSVLWAQTSLCRSYYQYRERERERVCVCVCVCLYCVPCVCSPTTVSDGDVHPSLVVPPTVSLELRPLSSLSWRYVQSLSQNPRLRYYTHLHKTFFFLGTLSHVTTHKSNYYNALVFSIVESPFISIVHALNHLAWEIPCHIHLLMLHVSTYIALVCALCCSFPL